MPAFDVRRRIVRDRRPRTAGPSPASAASGPSRPSAIARAAGTPTRPGSPPAPAWHPRPAPSTTRSMMSPYARPASRGRSNRTVASRRADRARDTALRRARIRAMSDASHDHLAAAAQRQHERVAFDAMRLDRQGAAGGEEHELRARRARPASAHEQRHRDQSQRSVHHAG